MGRYDEGLCHCALNRIFGFEPKIGHALISYAGSSSGVFEMDGQELFEALGPYCRYRDDICFRTLERTYEEMEKLRLEGCSFIPFCSEDFPSLLTDCEDPPLGLYYKGCSPAHEIFGNACNIAVVGTRDISQYGTEWCERIVRGIAESGAAPTIVSGLALGTDITAHRAALDSGVPTIAVMATGIDEVYPYRHAADAERIAGTPGCALVTDYPPHTAPLQINFLRRNRIIAGMSGATILIESRIRGGGMMTANLAFSYGREVYALPGRVDDPRSQGCNKLIHSRIAEPITDVVSLGKDMGLKLFAKKEAGPMARVKEKYAGSTEPESLRKMLSVMDAIRKNRGISIDGIGAVCGLGYSEVLELTGVMEADGLISSDLLQRYTVRRK